MLVPRRGERYLVRLNKRLQALERRLNTENAT
jgi:hypothetical protein